METDLIDIHDSLKPPVNAFVFSGWWKFRFTHNKMMRYNQLKLGPIMFELFEYFPGDGKQLSFRLFLKQLVRIRLSKKIKWNLKKIYKIF
jgi:hypothetical protein